MEHEKKQNIYFPHIDGLRAFAIILVLLYHSGLNIIRSGFIGVDIFFVISGYLIASISLSDFYNKKFSWRIFYKNRIWRLQPALIFTVFCTTILCFFVLLPDDLIEFSRGLRKISLFIANQYFNRISTGYFSTDSHQIPLIHLWSLAIEWQMYLLIPFILGITTFFVSKKNLSITLFFLITFFVVISFYKSHQSPNESYFLLTSRIYEFIVGSFVFTLSAPKYNNLNEILSFTALFILAGIALSKNIMFGYPNFYTLATIVASGCIIYFGQIENKIIKTALCNKAAIMIGKASYSLYLLHWVIFSILYYKDLDVSYYFLTCVVTIIIVSSFVMYHFFEQPIRKWGSKQNLSKTFFILILLPILVTHILSLIIKKNNGFPQRYGQNIQLIYHKLKKHEYANRRQCIDKNNIDFEKQCSFGSQKSNAKRALLIGDSFSNHYWGFLDAIGNDANVKVTAQGTSSCLTLPNLYLYDWWIFKNSIYKKCRKSTDQYYKLIKNNHYDYVILAEIWGSYLSNSIINKIGDHRSLPEAKLRIEQSLDQALKVITQSRAIPIIIERTAADLPNNLHDCFFKSYKHNKKYNKNNCRFVYKPNEGELFFDQLFKKMKNRYTTLIIVDPKKTQCQNNNCFADVHGVPFFRDQAHITDFASFHLGKHYINEFGNFIKKQ